jgi:hypothetical protein
MTADTPPKATLFEQHAQTILTSVILAAVIGDQMPKPVIGKTNPKQHHAQDKERPDPIERGVDIDDEHAGDAKRQT